MNVRRLRVVAVAFNERETNQRSVAPARDSIAQEDERNPDIQSSRTEVENKIEHYGEYNHHSPVRSFLP